MIPVTYTLVDAVTLQLTFAAAVALVFVINDPSGFRIRYK